MVAVTLVHIILFQGPIGPRGSLGEKGGSGAKVNSVF